MQDLDFTNNSLLPVSTAGSAVAVGHAGEGLDSYLRWINSIPMLTAEEEHNLVTRWVKQHDLAAARRLVFAHLRFVVRIARNYLGYGLSKEDLIQEGTIGLMKAVKHFDPQVGVRLVTFAVHWIRAEIHEYILRNWRMVKIATTKAQRKLFFNLRRATKRLNWFSRAETQQLAEKLQVTPEEVTQMEARMYNPDLSFEGGADSDAEESGNVPANYLAATASDPAEICARIATEQQGNERLFSALEQLDPRSRAILESRWLHDKKPTLHELAAKYHVSAERIRQIEAQALQKLRTLLTTT